MEKLLRPHFSSHFSSGDTPPCRKHFCVSTASWRMTVHPCRLMPQAVPSANQSDAIGPATGWFYAYQFSPFLCWKVDSCIRDLWIRRSKFLDTGDGWASQGRKKFIHLFLWQGTILASREIVVQFSSVSYRWLVSVLGCRGLHIGLCGRFKIQRGLQQGQTLALESPCYWLLWLWPLSSCGSQQPAKPFCLWAFHGAASGAVVLACDRKIFTLHI